MDNPNLSVVVLSFNTKSITHHCLTKLELAKKYCENRMKNRIEIIALDNGSSDDSVTMIKLDHPEVKLIVSKENTGFSKGNNIAMKEVNNPIILLLNSDVYVEEDSLYKALAYFKVNLNCDVMGAKLHYSTGKLQASAGNLPNPLNLITWILGIGTLPIVSALFPAFHPKNRAFFAKAHQVGWIMGAFFMFKKDIYDKTGGFDEKLFMHMEEVEWCKRIRSLGYKIWYVPQVEVTHLHGASTSFDMKSSFINELKGVKYYLKKHYSLLYWPLKLFLVLGLVLRVIAFTFTGKSDRARIYVEGIGLV